MYLYAFRSRWLLHTLTRCRRRCHTDPHRGGRLRAWRVPGDRLCSLVSAAGEAGTANAAEVLHSSDCRDRPNSIVAGSRQVPTAEVRCITFGAPPGATKHAVHVCLAMLGAASHFQETSFANAVGNRGFVHAYRLARTCTFVPFA